MIEFIIVIALSVGSFSTGKYAAEKKCQTLLNKERQKCYNSLIKCKLDVAKERCKDFKLAPTDQYKECIERATK